MAHELAIDQVSLWPSADARRLRGQVTFDPELTRDLDQPPSAERAEQLAATFLRENLVIRVDGTRCAANFQVRELYVRGGAVPGDTVMLDCPLPPEFHAFQITVGKLFPALVVTVSGFVPGEEPQSVLVRAGETSPPYVVGSVARSTWRSGGPEQFAPTPDDAREAAASSTPAPAPSQSRPVSNGPASPGEDRGFTKQGLGEILQHYLVVGFAHILPKGWDHVLFVMSLVLGAGQRWRRLVLELSLFTLAHTLTLGLGALGWLMVDSDIVEPLIALSIGYVAAENLLATPAGQRRLWVVLGFGLVHGQGFAGALTEVGLPNDMLLSALFGFNLGVELGQLLVALLIAVVLVSVPARRRLWGIVVPSSFLVLAASTYWLLERTLG